MAVQFGHPSSQKLLEDVGEILSGKGAIYQRNDKHRLFVCGGRVDNDADSLRALFLRWARQELPNFIPLLAETAYRESFSTDAPEFINLSKFEGIIADLCDCVLIFPESVGSYAEIGLFSGTQVKKKILVANDEAYYNGDTFLNLGPIATIHGRSALRPAIPIHRDNLEAGFRSVRERLSVRITQRVKRRQFHFKPYADLSFSEKLIAIVATITLLRALTLKGLEQSLKTTFSIAKPNRRELQQLLSLSVASGYVLRSGDYFLLNDRSVPFLDFEEIQVEDLKSRATLYYTRYHPSTIEQLRALAR